MTQTTDRLPQDLRGLGYPVCDRAAYEIDRLRAVLDGIVAGCDEHQPDGAIRGRQWAADIAKAALGREITHVG